MDIPEWTCLTCRYSGPCFECGGQEKVECRRNHPNNEGFPIMPISSWCWDGTPAYNQRRGKDESKKMEHPAHIPTEDPSGSRWELHPIDPSGR